MGYVARWTIGLVAVFLGGCSIGSNVAPFPLERHAGSDRVTSSGVHALERHGDFAITFANGKIAHYSDVSLSRKSGAGEWLSIRGSGVDWQYRTALIRSIADLGQRAAAIAVADLPLRTRAAVRAGTAQPDLTVCPYLSAGCCTIQNCASMDPWGVCIGPLCGISGDFGTGGGTNISRGLACDFDFESSNVDCYSAVPGDSSADPTPPDLFISRQLTAIDFTLTCANPVNPGYATATYADNNQHGGARKNVPVGPGRHTWNFPVDFATVLVGPIYPPTNPLSLQAMYYKFGVVKRWATALQGRCDYFS